MGIALGITLGIVINAYFTPIAEVAEAEEVEPEIVVAEEVLVEVIYTEEDIIRKIKEAFPEDSETAVKIARCESHLVIDIQSHHVLNGQREQSFGIFQIHSPSWDKVAKKLGYEDYRTDLGDNLAMARYIYDNAGKSWRDWSCYTKKMI